MHFAANCGNIIRQYCFAAEYALVAQPVEHLTFNQRARDSSSLERTKIPRGIARSLVGFSFYTPFARSLHGFCTVRVLRVGLCRAPDCCAIRALCGICRPCWLRSFPDAWNQCFSSSFRASVIKIVRQEDAVSGDFIAIQLFNATATTLNCISQICCLNVALIS